MAINETSVDGKKYRQKTTDGWKWYSFITKAKDVLFGDGEDANNNLETNLGSFKGITTSTNVTETGYAADATVVSDLNQSLVVDIYVGDDGKLHKVQGGADSVLPFNSDFTILQGCFARNRTINIEHDSTQCKIMHLLEPSWLNIRLNGTRIGSESLGSINASTGFGMSVTDTFEVKNGDVITMSTTTSLNIGYVIVY